MNNNPLVLLAHGSRNPEWLAPFEQLANDLRSDVGRDRVFLCYMESAAPTVLEIARQLAAKGTFRCRVLPLFLGRGSHFMDDIPAQLAEVKQQFPAFEIELLPPIGQHPLFLALMRQLARECASR